MAQKPRKSIRNPLQICPSEPSPVYTGTYYLRGFWARCIPEHIICEVSGPGVYRNVLFTRFSGQVHTGTYYLRGFWATCIPERIICDLLWPGPYRNAIFASYFKRCTHWKVLLAEGGALASWAGLVNQSAYRNALFAMFFATCIPERIIYDEF